MADENVEEQVADMREEVVNAMVAIHIPHNAYSEAWDVAGLAEEVKTKLNLDLRIKDWAARKASRTKKFESACSVPPMPPMLRKWRKNSRTVAHDRKAVRAAIA